MEIYTNKINSGKLSASDAYNQALREYTDSLSLPEYTKTSDCSCKTNYIFDSTSNKCIMDPNNLSQAVIAREKELLAKVDNNLSKRLRGKIILQTEESGEGWYIYPDNQKKYYLGRPSDAFSIMRNLGLGIKHNELTKYLNSKFSSKLSGKILLDIEQNGEAYYVNPKDLKGYFLNRPADAFRIMRELGLGITNTDIRKIDVSEVE